MKSSVIAPALLALVSISAGCATAGSASNPCGLVKAANDPFLGPVRGFNLYLDFGGYAAVGMLESKGEYTLKVLTVQRGDSRSVAAVGDQGEFAIGEQVLTFANSKEAKPVANANQATVFTQWILEYKLTREQANQVAKGPIKAIKVAIGNESLQMPIEPNPGLKIQNSISCMTKVVDSHSAQ
jgi:hypothetical protein